MLPAVGSLTTSPESKTDLNILLSERVGELGFRQCYIDKMKLTAYKYDYFKAALDLSR